MYDLKQAYVVWFGLDSILPAQDSSEPRWDVLPLCFASPGGSIPGD